MNNFFSFVPWAIPVIFFLGELSASQKGNDNLSLKKKSIRIIIIMEDKKWVKKSHRHNSAFFQIIWKYDAHVSLKKIPPVIPNFFRHHRFIVFFFFFLQKIIQVGYQLNTSISYSPHIYNM